MTLEDLKPGDILLCPPIPLSEGWIGQAIVLLTGGKVSHTAVYCGEENGEPRIAHSDLRGIIYMPLKAFMDEEPGCYIRRYKDRNDLRPVLEAVDTYAGKGNPYPVMNFGVLGLLLIGNKFTKDTLKSRIFYDFALLVSLKLIKEINKHKYPGKNPMTCSQFASQCYTNAGEEYEIKFEKLLLQFNPSDPVGNSMATCLLDYVTFDTENALSIAGETEGVTSENEDRIVSEFIHFMQNDANDMAEPVSDQKLSAVGLKLLMALCEVFTGQQPASVEEAMDMLSSNRNYFVTPDDLLTNTINLEDKGYFDKTIFSE